LEGLIDFLTMSVTFRPATKDFSDDVPELNCTNDGADALIRLLELSRFKQAPIGGIVPLDQLPEVRRKAIAAVSLTRRRAGEVVEPHVIQDRPDRPMKAFDMGISDEYLAERLAALQEIMAYAQEHGHDLAWG